MDDDVFLNVPSKDDDDDHIVVGIDDNAPTYMSHEYKRVPKELRGQIEAIGQTLEQKIQEAIATQPAFFDVPSSSLPSGTQINFNQLFQRPGSDELQQVARDSNGNLKKLSPEQISQIQQTGQFTIPSINFPGQEHTWVISRLLQKGARDIKDTDEAGLAIAFAQLLYMPDRFSGTPSIWNGIKWFGKGLLGIPALLFGAKSMKPRYYPNDISDEVLKQKTQYMMAGLKPDSSFPGNEIWQDESGNLYDLRLYSTTTSAKIMNILNSVDSQVRDEFNIQQVQLRKQIYNNLLQTNKDTPEMELLQQVEDQLAIEKQRRLLDRIQSNKAMATCDMLPHPKLIPLTQQVVDFFKRKLMYDTISNEYTQARSKKFEETENYLRSHYPIRSRISEWFLKHRNAAMAEYDKANEFAVETKYLEQLKAAGFTQEAYFFARGLEFDKQQAEALRASLAAEKIPSETFSFSYRIYQPKNWIIKPYTYSGATTYTVEKYTKSEVTTGSWFWRIRNIFHRIGSYWKNGVFVLFYFFGYSSLGIRSLYGIDNFFPEKTVNPNTGQLEVFRGRENSTYLGGLAQLWRGVFESRRRFESEKDEGFLGKSVTRFFNIVWNYFFVGFLGTVFYLPVRAFLTIGNIILMFFLIILSIVWAPGASLVSYIFNLLFWDADHPYRSEASVWTRFFPVLVQSIGKMGVLGIGQILVSIIGLILHPLLALIVALWTKFRTGCRKTYDLLMRNLIIKTRGRLPARNSFVAKRISGPGLSSNYFYQINPDLTLVIVQAYLENEELNYYEKHMTNLIQKPINALKEYFSNTFGVLGLATNLSTPMWTKITKRSTDLQDELTNRIKANFSARVVRYSGVSHRERIKLHRKDLEETIRQVEELIKEFSPRLFAWTDPIQFWQSMNLENGDWSGLTVSILKNVFSPDFMNPMEDADNNFSLKIEHIDAHKYAQMLVKRDIRDDLDRERPRYAPVVASVSTKIPGIYVSNFSTQYSANYAMQRYLESNRSNSASVVPLVTVPKETEV